MHLINGLHNVSSLQRRSVILPTFGADGLKTFIQGLLTHYTLSINYITCNISKKKTKKEKREGGRRALRAVRIVRVALFCIFCKTVNSAVPYS